MEGTTRDRVLIIWWNDSDSIKDSILRNSGYMCTAITRGKLYNHFIVI